MSGNPEFLTAAFKIQTFELLFDGINLWYARKLETNKYILYPSIPECSKWRRSSTCQWA